MQRCVDVISTETGRRGHIEQTRQQHFVYITAWVRAVELGKAAFDSHSLKDVPFRVINMKLLPKINCYYNYAEVV